KYLSIQTRSTENYDAFIITDKGKGMQENTSEKGEGIGMSIVDMMIKGMELDWQSDSTKHGTTISLIRRKNKDDSYFYILSTKSIIIEFSQKLKYIYFLKHEK